MDNASKRVCLPPLIADILHDPVTYIDNLFANGWKRLRFGSLISNAGFTKRSSVEVSKVVYLLLIWKWLNVSSISVFAQKALGLFRHAKKDVMYDPLKREDINWREFNLQAANASAKSINWTVSGLGLSCWMIRSKHDEVSAWKGWRVTSTMSAALTSWENRY